MFRAFNRSSNSVRGKCQSADAVVPCYSSCFDDPYRQQPKVGLNAREWYGSVWSDLSPVLILLKRIANPAWRQAAGLKWALSSVVLDSLLPCLLAMIGHGMRTLLLISFERGRPPLPSPLDRWRQEELATSDMGHPSAIVEVMKDA